MNKLKFGLKYINYRLTSSTEHDVHSPFVFNFINELLKNDQITYHDFDVLNKIRQELRNTTTSLEVTDFGAGSRVFKGSTRRIKDIAKHGISSRKYAELLYKIINKFQPKTVVELGTSIGLTTLYLAKPSSHTQVYTIEGCSHLADFSIKLFNRHKLKNIQLINEKFDTCLNDLLETIPSLDVFYVDGNHTKEATIQYFEKGLKKVTPNSIFIFDDIHWSNGMEDAWEEIRKHPLVTVSIDLFHLGILFFRKENKEQEHFTIRF